MKRADSIDQVVGHNVAILRLAQGLSQQEVGQKIGVSFQQMQKYEKGTNRISAGRLWHLANAFNVPVQAFYESLGPQTGRHQSPLRLIATRDSFQLVQLFAKIKNRAVRGSLVRLVGNLADRL